MALYASLERVCSRLPGVTDAVQQQANVIAATARGRLANHRETGLARIEVTRSSPDSLVSLVDRAAVSIEYGRGAEVIKGRHIGPAAGLYILSREL